jgi:hypothetical protein
VSCCASTYRIDFEMLRQLRGSRKTQIVEQLAQLYPDDEDADDYGDDEDRPPTLSEALAAIVNGDDIEDGSWPTYAEASNAIYQQFGVRLDANPISPSNPQFLEAVDEALEAAGVGGRFPIFDSGRTPPLLDEAPEPFPVLSHMTPEEVASARGVLGKIDWSSRPTEIQEAIKMIDTWVEEAAAQRQGLVCCYG